MAATFFPESQSRLVQGKFLLVTLNKFCTDRNIWFSGVIIESQTVIWYLLTIHTMMITMKNIETKTTKAKGLKHGSRRSLPRRKMPPYSSLLPHLQTLPIGHLQITTTPGPQTTIQTQTNSSSQLPKLALFVVQYFTLGGTSAEHVRKDGISWGRTLVVGTPNCHDIQAWGVQGANDPLSTKSICVLCCRQAVRNDILLFCIAKLDVW